MNKQEDKNTPKAAWSQPTVEEFDINDITLGAKIGNPVEVSPTVGPS